MFILVRIFQWSITIAIVHSCCWKAPSNPNSKKTNSQWYFSTLTSYDHVSSEEINLSEGTPDQIFMVINHSTSHPAWYDIKEGRYYEHQIKDKLEITKNDNMPHPDIKEIKKWIPKLFKKDVTGLVKKGRDEIKKFAKRIRKAFPNIFIKKYNTDDYYVLTRQEQYCRETGQLFLKNIFKDRSIDTVPVCDKNNQILMIDDLQNHRSLKRMQNIEFEYFLDSDDMKNVVQRIFKKIGREASNHVADRNLVFSLYNTCAIERSHDEKSIPPLCRLFCEEDLDVLEYMNDLRYYFDEGYGNVFSAKYACPMAIRLLESFENKIQGEGPNGVFYFGNSVNILNLYVMLGLAKDEVPLMSSNYKSMKNRMWRTSLLAPLAANFTAVLLKKDFNQYDVVFYFNEKRKTISINDRTACEICSWPDIQKKLTSYIHEYRCRSDIDIDYPSYKKSNPYWYFSTKTAYNFVFSNEIKKEQSDTPVQIFAVMRHDITLPSDDFVKEWSRYNVYKYKITAKAKLSWSDISCIRSWQWYFTDDDKDRYSYKNRFRIKSITNRIQEAFPNLLSELYNSENFKVLSRPEQICKDTGEIFLQHLFDDKSITSVPEWEYNNQLLMVGNLDENDSKNIYLNESESFKESIYIKNILIRVAIKMGLEPDALGEDFGFINHSYEACRFEVSRYDEFVPTLCNLFCREDLKALEYIEDLLWYYTAGYGNPLYLQQACLMAKSLLETFKTKTEGRGPKGVFHFGNALNIFSLYVILGLAKDETPLTSTNYNDMKNRKWRTSLMVPWLANFMAVLFLSDNNEYKVAFYFNENRMPITLNDGNICGVCGWTEIENLLMKYIERNQCT